MIPGKTLCIVVAVALAFGCVSKTDDSSDATSLEERYIAELKRSRDWPDLSVRLGDLRSLEAVAYFFGEMARAYPERIGLPARSEVEKQEFRRREGDLFEGCVFALITMMERMGEQEFLKLVISILDDRGRPPEVRAMAADTLSDCPGESTELVRPALLECASDRDPLVRRNVAAALAKIEDPTKRQAPSN